MDWETLANFIVNNGIAIVVVIYFLWKDSNLTKENTAILQQVKSLLESLIHRGDFNVKD